MLQPLSREQHLWRWRILFATYFAYAGYYLTRKAFTICKSTIAEMFSADYGISVEAGVNLASNAWFAYLVAYAIGQFANSFLGRRHGPRVILLTGFGLSIVINTIFGFANSYYTFLVFMVFNGLVQASGWPGAVGGVSQWLRPHERGSIMGFWSTSYLVGNLMVKYIGGLLLDAMGWRYAFFGLSAISFGIWWIVYFWQRNKPQDVGLDPIVQKQAIDERAVRASQEDHVNALDYFRLALNPVVLTMGVSYFCIKFLRYALDSWLPLFLNFQGMGVGEASYYSSIFDNAGIAGAIVAGLVLDRFFRGNWAALCFTMGLGLIAGYLSVIYLGDSPVRIAWCFGIVGFMLYGPDTLLAGAAAVQVAGEKNGVAVAGVVNGIASTGPILQEWVIARLVSGGVLEGIQNTNRLALGMSVLFVFFMMIMMWRLHVTHKGHREADARNSGL
ncbi:MAG: hypothetical protein AMXMBFR84_13330 [Candidatus Hydrogenedentota bacterium]